MIYAGIDIAKNSHVIGATDERGKDAAKPMQFANSTAGFDRCAAYLLLSTYRVLTVPIEPFRMRCSYWLGGYVVMRPEAISRPR